MQLLLMTAPGRRILREFRFGLLALLPIFIVLALLVFFPPDGKERAEWMQFIGRFHPLVVHFPIALILLVPILELVGRSARLSHLRLSTSFLLGLATLSATAAAVLGWCLGRGGGYSGPLVTQHMWGGILLTFTCWLCWALRARLSQPGTLVGIPLAVAVVLVAWTGYRGGQLSLGADHLKERLLGLRPGTISSGLVTWNGGAVRAAILREALLLDAGVSLGLSKLGVRLAGLSSYAICAKSAW